MGSFAIPLSGLTAAQDDLQSVSNNLANINTDGYKDENLTFSDLISQAGGTNGSGDPLQTGSGVTVASTTSNFTEGTLSATGNASNMALSGNGFFITQGANGLPDYTRAGDFTSNSSGQLTTPDGQLLLGYPALNGVINTSAALQPMQVGSVTSPAVTTQNLEITANLDAGATLGSAAATTTSSLDVYDSLGGSHTLAMSYTMTAPNTWSYSATVPNADLSTGGAGVTLVASGTLNFNSSGVLISTEPTGGTATVAPSAGITLAIPPTTSPVTTFVDGAAPMSVNWNLLDASGNSIVTQTASAGTTSATNQDGFASGSLSSYAVQPNGTIVGTFSSGTSLDLGQVAVASFGNVEGLVSLGNNSYQATAASGSAVVGAAGTGGRGTVVGGSVEQSNVDIATEFAKLIVAQQAYSANAKSITTFNQVSQATLAMIQ